MYITPNMLYVINCKHYLNIAGDIADETVQSDVICAFPVETSTQIDDQPNVRRSAIENISQIEASNSGQFLNVPESGKNYYTHSF